MCVSFCINLVVQNTAPANVTFQRAKYLLSFLGWRVQTVCIADFS
jgi:hypothetical protein